MSDIVCPLLITRFSLSERSAIGVQTGHIARQSNPFRHIFWSQYELAKANASSERLENLLFSRYSILKKNNRVSRLAQWMGLSWWQNDRLKPRYRSMLKSLRAKTSVIYLAPIDSEDSRRMNDIMSEFPGIPVILHLWDCLDDNLQRDPITRSLIQRARKVFCLNEMIRTEVLQIRSDAEIIPFRRLPSPFKATFLPKVKRTIVLLGDIISYRDGVVMLLDALKLLNSSKISLEVLYIGAPSTLRKVECSSSVIRATGFVSSTERDRLVSQCDIGFLPGPTNSPINDARSRYSVPSRLLDFLAAGLPITGALHPLSAAMQMCRSVGLEIGMDCQSPEQLASRIATLLEPKVWAAASERSLRASQLFTVQYDGLIRELCAA